MRYITWHDDLILMKNNGKMAHHFGQYGICVVGDPTTHTGAGNYIDAADTGTEALNLQLLFPTDLDGNTTYRIERAGLGSLNGKSYSGGTLNRFNDGYKGFFFESPILTGTTSTVSAIAGAKYIVLTDSVIYSGVTYHAGDTFVTAGSVTATTGSGKFALTFPDDFDSTCDAFLDCQFKIKHTMRGDEPNDFYDWPEAGGYDPRDSLVCTDDGVYWMR